MATDIRRRPRAKTASPAVKAPVVVETIAEAEARMQAEWAELQRRKLTEHQRALTGGRRVQPPDGTGGWSRGGHVHEYLGEPIDCADCAAWVASMSEEERVADMRLRPSFDSVHVGVDPLVTSVELILDEQERRRQYVARQEAASWRLVD